MTAGWLTHTQQLLAHRMAYGSKKHTKGVFFVIIKHVFVCYFLFSAISFAMFCGTTS